MNVTPHVAAKSKGSAIDGRTTRHAGYAISQRIRKRIEEPFGWSKTVGLAAKTMLRGLERVGGQFIFNLAAYNLPPAQASRRIRKKQSGRIPPCHPLSKRLPRRNTVPPSLLFSSLLEPVFEADLPPEQYGYRPERNAQQAVTEVRELMFRRRPEWSTPTWRTTSGPFPMPIC